MFFLGWGHCSSSGESYYNGADDMSRMIKGFFSPFLYIVFGFYVSQFESGDCNPSFFLCLDLAYSCCEADRIDACG